MNFSHYSIVLHLPWQFHLEVVVCHLLNLGYGQSRWQSRVHFTSLVDIWFAYERPLVYPFDMISQVLKYALIPHHITCSFVSRYPIRF